MPSPFHFFPKSFVLEIRSFSQKIFGGLCIALSIFLFGALISFHFWDNSLNASSLEACMNWFGQSGAYVADILFQGWGKLAYGFAFAFFIYGFKILVYGQNLLGLGRFCALLLSLTLLSISLQSCWIDQVSGKVLPPVVPFCGAFGYLLARKLYAFIQNLGGGRFFFCLALSLFWIGLTLWKVATQTGPGILWKGIKKTFGWIRKFKIHKAELTKPLNLEENELPVKEAPLESRQNFENLNTKHGYQKPSPDILKAIKEDSANSFSKEALQASSKELLRVLKEFGIDGEILDVQPGPIVTMYEFCPAPGIKTSRVISLADDIARSMSALSARIATIPGKNAIGIELPNSKRQTVYLKPILQSSVYRQSSARLPLILGKDIAGGQVVVDLAKMPHLLVAGTTGSGKSVSINTMILSLLFKFTPQQCRFIMVDPKMLELSVYNDIPHLLTPVVTEPKKAIFALKWAVREMESRYKAMSILGVRNIENFNQKIQVGKQKGDVFKQRIQTGFDPETGKPIFEDKLLTYQEFPYIVVVVDEMADLMLVAGKEIESAVQRLAQMARAAGIHLIMATQRPSVDVITGTIKANFPTRISFQVTSKIDSRTILGEQGAEQLLGHGDMLYMSGGGRIQRVHGPFVSDDDVEDVARFLCAQSEPDYVDGVTDEIEGLLEDASGSNQQGDLYQQAVDFVRREGRVSISFIQRQFQIGYNKSAKLVERMEKEGIVSTPDRTGKRELLS